MSSALNCCPNCSTPLVQNVPGTAGQSAFTTTTADFVVPALGGQVTISVANSSWMNVGASYFITAAGYFTLDAIPSLTSITLTYQNIAANTAAGNTISSGAKVTAGSIGSNGVDGVNAYTVTTANVIIPAIGANVTFPVANSSWMVVGQTVFASDGTDMGHFAVVSKADTISFVGEFLGFNGDSAAAATINSGAGVSPGGSEIATPVSVALGGTGSATATLARAALGVGGASLTVYAAGTAYSLTNTAAALDFGTTDPALVITSAGTWLLLARVRVDYTAATFAAVRTGTLKLRRTNNTAADLGNGSASFLTDIITTLTYTLDVLSLPPVIYVTTNANDAITIFGDISVVPTAGSLDCVQAEIVAIKLFDQTI